MKKIKAWIKKNPITTIISIFLVVSVPLLFLNGDFVSGVLVIIGGLLLFFIKHFIKHFIIAISVIVGGLLFAVLLFLLSFEDICFPEKDNVFTRYCEYLALSTDDTGWGRISDNKDSQDTESSKDSQASKDTNSPIEYPALSTKNCRPSIKNCRPPAKNCHPPTKNCRPPTKNCRPPTKNCHPSTKNCRPSVKNCHPSTKDCCPPTENFVPATKNITPTKEFKPSIGTLMERLGFIAGGLIALLVALATFWRAKASEETAEAQNRTADEQEKGNFQERYKNTFAQLNNEEASIRVAGFYSLYRLAQDNKDYRRIVCDVLCVYVRERTNSVITIKLPNSNETRNIFYREKYSKEPDNEIQSIIDLLTNKEPGENCPFKSKWINLSGAYLVGTNFVKSVLKEANLRKAQMKGAHFKDAQLQGAKLGYAQLQQADLKDAQLQGAKLFCSQLQGAILENAQLQKANLKKAQLQGAELSSAQLQGVNLEEAQMQGAILQEAQLQGANLSNAQLQGALLQGTHLQGADLFNAQLQGANLYFARLQGATLQEAQLQKADLAGVQMQGANLNSAQLQGANLFDTRLQGADLFNTNLQEAKLNRINLVGTVSSTTPSHTIGIAQLENRIGKNTDLKTTKFSGGVHERYIKNLEEKTQEALIYLKDDFQKEFKEKMDEVLQTLKKHNKQPRNISLPLEGYKKIDIKDYKKLLEEEQRITRSIITKEKYIITGTLDRATADETIEELKAIEKEVAEINKKYSNR